MSTPCTVEGCDRPHYGRGHTDSYKASHRRLGEQRGKAKEYPCQHCGNQAEEWAYNRQADDEKAGQEQGIELSYSPTLDRYIPLCISCHRRFDATIRHMKRGWRCVNGHDLVVEGAENKYGRYCKACRRECEQRRRDRLKAT